MAMSSPAVVRSPMAQPATRQLQTSNTIARYAKPTQIGMWIISAAHGRFGPSARERAALVESPSPLFRLLRQRAALYRNDDEIDAIDGQILINFQSQQEVFDNQILIGHEHKFFGTKLSLEQLGE